MTRPILFAASAVFLMALAPTARADLVLVVNSVPGSPSQGNILAYDAVTGAPAGTGPLISAGSGGLGVPAALAVDSAGNLFVADSADSSVKEYDAAGNFQRVFVPPGSGGLQGPTALQFTPTGDLLIVSGDSSSVLDYDGMTGEFLRTLITTGLGGLNSPQAMAFHNGSLYLASHGSDQVLQYDAATGAFQGVVVDAGEAGLSRPSGLAFGPNGALYVASQGSGEVLRHGDVGGTTAFISAGSGGLGTPTDLAFATDGRLLVGSSSGSNSQILSFDAITGQPIGQNFIPPGSGGLDTPIGIIVVKPVPEPGSLALASLGLLAIGTFRVAARRHSHEDSSTEKGV